jgi:Synaptobrevin
MRLAISSLSHASLFSAFAFLEAVQTDLLKKFRTNRIQRCKAMDLDADFKPTLRTTIHHYNVHAASIGREQKTQALMTQVQDLKQVMGRNIQLMLDNTTKVDILLDKSDSMMADANMFKKRAKVSRQKQRQKYYMMTGICVVLGFFMLYMVMIGVCGVGLTQCRASSSSSSSNQQSSSSSSSSSNYNNANYNANNNDGNANNANNNNGNRYVRRL